MIHPQRLIEHQPASAGTEQTKDRFVLYWMQQSQRMTDNHALAYGAHLANRAGLPLLVVFALTDSYPEANERHYRFMAEGLTELAGNLAGWGASFLVLHGAAQDVLVPLLPRSASLVLDSGVLRHQRQWREAVIRQAQTVMDGEITEVDTDLVVPVRVASGKEEYGARTLRPKIHRALDRFTQGAPLPPLSRREPDLGRRLAGALGLPVRDSGSAVALLKGLDLDRSVAPVRRFRGGETQARARLERFLEERLAGYADKNVPGSSLSSELSPYLHFGQLSPVTVIRALRSRRADAPPGEGEQSFLEELVVRRELAFNFVFYNTGYDRFGTMTHPWAYQTMKDHRDDPREFLYDLDQLEQAKTHDPYWNAAMEEMRLTGFMHSYMRMYWGKKIIEWSPDPETAWGRTLHLNNKYFLDGRDPNSFCGVAWCFGKHDRAWQERPVFGKLRYMNARGLERKFDMARYIRQVAGLRQEETD